MFQSVFEVFSEISSFDLNLNSGIMAMVGLICLIFGFWCGKNCSAHSVSNFCCKFCVFWCDDDFVDEDEYDEDESAWNWKAAGSVTSSSFARKLRRKRMERTSEDTADDERGRKAATSKMALTRKRHRDYRSTNRDVRLRQLSTPMSSHSMLLGQQQNVEQSPDVRVAHFSTPMVATHGVLPSDSVQGYVLSVHFRIFAVFHCAELR